MAKALDTRFTSADLPGSSVSLRQVSALRLAFGLVASLGTIIFLEGTCWDIQWHTYIGRDRTLIPPHILMLTGVTISGVAGLGLVVIETFWSRRNQTVARQGYGFAAIFRAPLGAYLVGYAALLAAVAFPLDAYWHALYGIDVAIWAPFHIMFVTSMGLVSLGVTYLLLSAAHLAEQAGAPGLRRAAYVGATLALATLLSLFTLLLFDAFKEGNLINFGVGAINVFPLLCCTLIAFTFVTASSVIPWRLAAPAVAGFYLLLAGIMAVFVQPATDWLLSVEQLHYREQPPFTAVVALEWFLTPVLVAFLINLIERRSRSRQWSRRKQTLWLIVCALVSGLFPIISISPYLPVVLALQVGLAGYLPTALLGAAGAWLGITFGRTASESLSGLEK